MRPAQAASLFLLLGLTTLAGVADDAGTRKAIAAPREGITLTLTPDSGSIDVSIVMQGVRLEESRGVPSVRKSVPIGKPLGFTAQATDKGGKITAVVEIWKAGKQVSKVSATGPNVAGFLTNNKPQLVAF